MKIDAKLDDLAPPTPKFAKRSSIGIFGKKEPDPLHWTQNSYFGRFGPFHFYTKIDEKLAEHGAINVQIRETKLRRNFSQRVHPIHSIGPKTHVLGRF
jgi:hypothetical protein